MKDLKRAATVIGCISLVYVMLLYFLSRTEFSLRMWVNVLGEIITALLLPLSLVVLMLIKAYERDWKWKGLLTGLAVAAYAFCAYWMVLFIVFGMQEETKLMKDLLVVEEGGFLDHGSYAYYRPVGIFFRTPVEFTNEMKIEYLENKYHRKFMTDPNNNKRICDRELPEIKVAVYLLNRQLSDDYVEGMTVKYLLEGYEALGMERSYYLSDTTVGANGDMYVVFDEEDDISAAAQDIRRLIVYAMDQTDFFDDWNCHIGFSYGEDSSGPAGEVSFGKPDDVGESSYIPDTDEIEDLIWMRCMSQVNTYKWIKRSEQKYRDRMQEGEEGEPEAEDYADSIDSEDEIKDKKSDEETQSGTNTDDILNDWEVKEDNVETAARVLYDTVFAEEGYSYEVCYNAKGNLYIDLGHKESDEYNEGNLSSSYRLVYDRSSKNGSCELFVLYRSTEGTENEVIVDMYAVETATKKVVASGKRTWSDVGTKEYREITGE